MPDVPLRRLRLHGFFYGEGRRIDALYAREFCIKQLPTIFDTACNQHDRNMMSLSSPENAKGQLAHKRLTVGSAFARDNERGVCKLFVKADCIEQEVYA